MWAGYPLRQLLFLHSMGCGGFSNCSLWSRVQLCHMDFVAPQHVESSWILDGTCVLCIGRQILNHSTPREVLFNVFLLLTVEPIGCLKADPAIPS